jgi:hypothetical protein
MTSVVAESNLALKSAERHWGLAQSGSFSTKFQRLYTYVRRQVEDGRRRHFSPMGRGHRNGFLLLVNGLREGGDRTRILRQDAAARTASDLSPYR